MEDQASTAPHQLASQIDLQMAMGTRSPIPRGTSSIVDRGWERVAPHTKTNGENSLPIGSSGFGDVQPVLLPETRIPAPLIEIYVQNVDVEAQDARSI